MKISNKNLSYVLIFLAIITFLVFPPIQIIYLPSETEIIWKLVYKTETEVESKGFGPIVPLRYMGTSFEFDYMPPRKDPFFHKMMCLFVGNFVLLVFILMISIKKWREKIVNQDSSEPIEFTTGYLHHILQFSSILSGQGEGLTLTHPCLSFMT